MTVPANTQYGRKVKLLALNGGGKALDLSALHFRFQTSQNDEESPSNCSIRIHNLGPEALTGLQSEFNHVQLYAGYESTDCGLIFDGTIKQFRVGKEGNNHTKYVDLLISDGDLGYNWAFNKQTLQAGTTGKQRFDAAVASAKQYGLLSNTWMTEGLGGVLPRGKVLFGLAKGHIRAQAQNLGCTWSIQNGVIQVIPLAGYLPGEAVVLNAQTGLIGRPEQTADGVKVRCLMNSKINVGGLIKIDQASVNRTFAQDPNVTRGAGQLAYNKYAGVQLLADITSDGLYRVYVAEYIGDTRGQDWYVDLICLSVDAATKKVIAQ